MKRVLSWILSNLTFAVIIYFGCIKGIQGAENLVVFISWFMFMLSLGCFSDETFRRMKKKGGRPVPKIIDFCFDFVIIIILIWNSFFLSSIAYTMHAIILMWFWDEIDKSLKTENRKQENE